MGSGFYLLLLRGYVIVIIYIYIGFILRDVCIRGFVYHDWSVCVCVCVFVLVLSEPGVW